jgi:hypothetical protein
VRAKKAKAAAYALLRATAVGVLLTDPQSALATEAAGETLLQIEIWPAFGSALSYQEQQCPANSLPTSCISRKRSTISARPTPSSTHLMR